VTGPAGVTGPSRWPAARWWVAAAVTAVVSLGLPWSVTGGYTSPGFVVPDISVANPADGTITTIPGMIGLPITSPGLHLAGYQTPARVLVVVAAVLLVVAVRRRSPRWGVAGLAVAAFGLVLAGVPLTGGGAVYLAALVLLAVALRRSALLPRRGGVPWES